MSRTQSGAQSTYKFDPLNALAMQDRSRSPAPRRGRKDGGGVSRRRSQSRADSGASGSRIAEQSMWLGQPGGQPDRPALPVRHGNTDWHDTPADADPYTEQANEVYDDDEEEEEEEDGCDDGEEEEAEHDDGPPLGERPAPPWEPPAPARTNQPIRRERGRHREASLPT